MGDPEIMAVWDEMVLKGQEYDALQAALEASQERERMLTERIAAYERGGMVWDGALDYPDGKFLMIYDDVTGRWNRARDVDVIARIGEWERVLRELLSEIRIAQPMGENGCVFCGELIGRRHKDDCMILRIDAALAETPEKE